MLANDDVGSQNQMCLIPKSMAYRFGFLCSSRPPPREGATARLGRKEHQTEARRWKA